MRNKWTLSGDLKSPGLKTVPVRFRLAAPESSCNLLMDCRSFCCIIGIFLNFSEMLKIGNNCEISRFDRLLADFSQACTKNGAYFVLIREVS